MCRVLIHSLSFCSLSLWFPTQVLHVRLGLLHCLRVCLWKSGFFFSRRFKWIFYQHFLHTVLPKTVRYVRYDQSKIRTEQSKLNDCCKYSSVWLGVLDEFWYFFIVLLFVYFLYNADLETQLNRVFFFLDRTQRYWIGYYIQKNKNKTLVALANKPLLMLYSRNSVTWSWALKPVNRIGFYFLKHEHSWRMQ